MEKVILRKSGSFEKDLEYKIIHYHKNPSNPAFMISGENSLIRPAEIQENPSDGHYLIERYQSLGGGCGGWDSKTKFVGIAHGKEELQKKLYECALFYAKTLANRLKIEFVDESSVEKVENLEK